MSKLLGVVKLHLFFTSPGCFDVLIRESLHQAVYNPATQLTVITLTMAGNSLKWSPFVSLFAAKNSASQRQPGIKTGLQTHQCPRSRDSFESPYSVELSSVSRMYGLFSPEPLLRVCFVDDHYLVARMNYVDNFDRRMHACP